MPSLQCALSPPWVVRRHPGPGLLRAGGPGKAQRLGVVQARAAPPGCCVLSALFAFIHANPELSLGKEDLLHLQRSAQSSSGIFLAHN